jgi:hypothetical protein
MRRGVGVCFVVALALVDARAQAPPPGVVLNEGDIEPLVARFHARADDYAIAFRNLVAEETKLTEVYRASGEVEKRRHLVSDLVVYHSSRDGRDATTEYRDVLAVDGKVVEKRRERALKLLTNAARAKSLEKELQAIDRETSRHEFSRRIRGGVINQLGIPKEWRQRYQVRLEGREQIAGRDIVVLAYRQTAPNPGSRQSLPLPRELGKAAILSRGRLWLDAETGQLWRSVWELVVPHPAAADPLVMIRAESTYAPSRFGILVPQRIVFDWLGRYSHPKNGRPSFALSERTTFSYDSFRRFDVATDEIVQTPGP